MNFNNIIIVILFLYIFLIFILYLYSDYLIKIEYPINIYHPFSSVPIISMFIYNEFNQINERI